MPWSLSLTDSALAREREREDISQGGVKLRGDWRARKPSQGNRSLFEPSECKIFNPRS